MALTRNRAEAEDLAQDAVANALRARGSVTPGTNFTAWMHYILRNRFISILRKCRGTVELEDPSFGRSAAPAQEDLLTLKALHRALGRPPAEQREALIMVVLHGLDVAAEHRAKLFTTDDAGHRGTAA